MNARLNFTLKPSSSANQKSISLIVGSYTLTDLGGQAYITVGKYESALEDCEMAILMNPNFIKAYYRKALALYEMTNKVGTDV